MNAVVGLNNSISGLTSKELEPDIEESNFESGLIKSECDSRSFDSVVSEDDDKFSIFALLKRLYFTISRIKIIIKMISNNPPTAIPTTNPISLEDQSFRLFWSLL